MRGKAAPGRRRAWPACALLATALIGACGGDGDREPAAGKPGDRAAVQQVVARYVGAYLDGRGEEACALYTDRLRERIEARARVRRVESCEEAIGVASRIALTGQPPAMRRRLRGVLAEPGRVGVELDGDRATAGLDLPGTGRSTPTRLGLERAGERWRIAEVGVTGAR